MNKDLTNKQMRVFFIRNSVAFAMIFLALGIIIMAFLNQTSYQDVDNQLKRITSSPMFVIAQNTDGSVMIMPQGGMGMGNHSNFSDNQAGSGQLGFATNIIFWTSNHKMLTDTQTSRQISASDIDFGNLRENTIQDFSFQSPFGETMYFRSLMVPFRTNADSTIAYMQVISNVNQIRDSVSAFQKLVIWSMIVFWLLSLFVSFFLAQKAITPLILAWKKQQEFVENASHELRTPLAIIQNKLELLFLKPGETIMDNSEPIADSLGEIRRLRNLTSDLLTLARRDGMQIEVKNEKMNLAEFITKLTNDYADLALLDEKILTYDAKNSEKEIQMDPKLLQQLLVILMDNAIKYTENGDEIMVSSEILKNEIELKIKDTGLGIDDEKKKVIFERFTRVDGSRNKSTGGFGLGLSIAKQIVEQMNGKIEVADNFPKGSIFIVRLPRI
ncbi:MAG: HAMP domain-containing histidine kinase [Streptococcaceae bacterium]|nr:HAMP domain-containing histidine kinase [Streptococcaceae bacterium]